MGLRERIWKIRERINISLFDSKERVTHILSRISMLFMLVVFAGIIYYYGFPKTESSVYINMILIRSILVYFLLRFLILFFYDFHPLQFLKERWFEGLVLLLFFIDAVSPEYFDDMLVYGSLKAFVKQHSLLVFQLYFLSVGVATCSPAYRAFEYRPRKASGAFIRSFDSFRYGFADAPRNDYIAQYALGRCSFYSYQCQLCYRAYGSGYGPVFYLERADCHSDTYPARRN